jgi:hypothetical protein
MIIYIGTGVGDSALFQRASAAAWNNFPCKPSACLDPDTPLFAGRDGATSAMILSNSCSGIGGDLSGLRVYSTSKAFVAGGNLSLSGLFSGKSSSVRTGPGAIRVTGGDSIFCSGCAEALFFWALDSMLKYIEFALYPSSSPPQNTHTHTRTHTHTHTHAATQLLILRSGAGVRRQVKRREGQRWWGGSGRP